MREHSRGYILLTTMLLLILVTALLLGLHIEAASQWMLARNVAGQLHSLVLAENGVECARALIPHLDLNELLAGQDGRFSGTARPQWRNPATFEQARILQPENWFPEVDDGIPFPDGALVSGKYAAPGGGGFLLRFSNNPEEAPEQDSDQIIVVRSLGLVPARLRDPFFGCAINDITLIEARFRQETSFLLPSPLTLLGSSAAVEWSGSEFWVHGESEFAVSVVSPGGGLLEDVVNSLSDDQRDCLSGFGLRPSVQDASALYRDHPAYARLLASEFWPHFLRELPGWANRAPDNVRWMPDGGILDRPFSGLILARGDLDLVDGCLITGLVLHFGAGTVSLQGEARIRGGLWLCEAVSSPHPASAGPLRLRVQDRASLLYDRAAIREAVKSFPPTQLGWRILFPEMSS
jgi:hypothetical protein